VYSGITIQMRLHITIALVALTTSCHGTQKTADASVSASSSAATAPSIDVELVDDSLPTPVPSASETPPQPSSDTRAVVAIVLQTVNGLEGTWVGVDGDALPDGPTGGKIVKGGSRIQFIEKKPGSITPWNLVAWVPVDGHMASDAKDPKSMTIGCGFYPDLHDDVWRVSFCKGYGLTGEKVVPERLELRKAGDVLSVDIGTLIEIRVRKK
jgi:hypothetical protein